MSSYLVCALMAWYHSRGKGGNNSWRKGASWGARTKWWPCTDADCCSARKATGLKPWYNPPDARRCEICHTWWQEAGKVTTAVASARKNLATSKANVAKASVMPAAAVVKNRGPSDKAPPKNTAQYTEADASADLMLTQEYLAIEPLLELPAELTSDWSVKEAFAKFLPKKGNKAGTEQLEEEVLDQENLLDLCVKKLPGTKGLDAPAIRKKLEALRKQLQKARDGGAAVAELAVCELEVARRQATIAENSREARASAAAAKAEERADRLEQICVEQITAWEEKLEAIREMRTEREEAWEERTSALQVRGTELLAHADERIAAARAKAGTDAATPPALSHNLELADAMAELKKMKAEADIAALAAEERQKTLEEKIAAMEKSNSPQRPAIARLSDTVHGQCSRTVLYSESELPQLLSAPEETTKRHLAQLHANLMAWGQSGQVPITFEQLLTGTPLDEMDAALITLKEATGETIWTRFYGKTGTASYDYVPFQLGTVLNASLARAGAMMEKLAEENKLQDLAKTSFQGIRSSDEAAKRARTGPYEQ